MGEIERRAAFHASWRVATIIGAIVGLVLVLGFGTLWLSERLGRPGAPFMVMGGLLGCGAIAGLWSSIYSYAKRQVQNGTPKKEWWF